MQPVVQRYVPRYRTSWFRAPLTYYRPVTVYQGVLAQPAPVMQPCNTYAWQAQRVPSLFFHQPANVVQYLPAYAPAVAPAVVAPPAYGASPAPASSVLNGSVPGYSEPSPAPIGTGVLPADQPPSLPADTVPSGAVPDSALRLNPSSPAAVPESGGAGATNSVYQVKPIPVPAAQGRPAVPAPAAPPLLPGRDRTAAARAPAVTPAVWQAPAAETAAKAASRTTPAKLWDDSGWQSARGW
jgi:hypothetical protein